MIEALVWLAVLALILMAFLSIGHRRTRVGSASAGTIYDWLNQDKRKAIEIVVDGQAERQDGEHAEGNLPELEDPEPKAAPDERRRDDQRLGLGSGKADVRSG